MQLNIVNLTGSTKTYLSNSLSVSGNSTLSVTDLSQQLALSTDGQLRSDIFANFVQITDGINTFSANDAIAYLSQMPFSLNIRGWFDSSIKEDQPSTIFYDGYEQASLETTNKWNSAVLVGTASYNQTGNTGNLVTGTTASNGVSVTSQPVFNASGTKYGLFFALNIETPVLTNNHRFWGVADTPGSWTAATPLNDAIGMEVDTSGNLNAVIYTSGTKSVSGSLNNYKSYFTGGPPGIVFIEFDPGGMSWYVGTNIKSALQQPVFTSTGPPPTVSNLPIRVHSINGTTPPSSSPTDSISAVYMLDLAKTGSSIQDGIYGWRKATVKPQGFSNLTTDTELVVRSIPSDGTKNTYSASITGLVTGTTATDIFTLTGSSTKTIKVTRIEISGTTGGLGGQTPDIQLIKRSSANTGGTSTTRTNVPHDSSNPAATATIRAYTANPSALGTAVGNLRAQKINFPNAGQTGSLLLFWDFGNRPAEGITIRGTSEVLALNLNSTTLNTPLIDISIEFTEE